MIGAIGPADLLALRRTPSREQVLYTEQQLTWQHRPFGFALRSLLGGQRYGYTTLVSREPEGSALLQARGRPGRAAQDIVYLASEGQPDRQLTEYERWFRLLEHWTALSARTAVERLYAALPQRHDELHEIFRQAGFRWYTQQVILQWTGTERTMAPADVALRVQAGRDLWAIQRLYSATTPPVVQQAEMRTAQSWALSGQRLRPWRRAWLLERDDDLTAVLRVVSGRIGHVLTLLLKPEAREALEDVLAFGLRQIPAGQRVFLVLRRYQQELIGAAERMNFQVMGEQDLMMRNTTQLVRSSVFQPALERTMKARLHLQR